MRIVIGVAMGVIRYGSRHLILGGQGEFSPFYAALLQPLGRLPYRQAHAVWLRLLPIPLLLSRPSPYLVQGARLVMLLAMALRDAPELEIA